MPGDLSVPPSDDIDWQGTVPFLEEVNPKNESGLNPLKGKDRINLRAQNSFTDYVKEFRK